MDTPHGGEVLEAPLGRSTSFTSGSEAGETLSSQEGHSTTLPGGGHLCPSWVHLTIIVESHPGPGLRQASGPFKLAKSSSIAEAHSLLEGSQGARGLVAS